MLITTGRFTQEAVLKAANERAPEIRLIDGEELVGKLKELSLGVRTEQVVVERVIIERDWFGGGVGAESQRKLDMVIHNVKLRYL